MYFTLSMSVFLFRVSVGYLVPVELRFPATESTDACEPSCGCWELNPDPLQEQQALSPTAEPSLQSPPPFIYGGEGEFLACPVSWD